MPPDAPDEIVVDIAGWVERARADPAAYLERQATEVFLNALGMAEPYCDGIFLKGGILMGVVYASPRQTADIDFTADLEPSPELVGRLRESLTAVLPRAAAGLGYPDLICRVQAVRPRPRREGFARADRPALEITVGYARRGSAEERHLARNNAVHVLAADISFKEPVGAIRVVRLGTGGARIRAYSLLDVLAEKFRALLQQETRNRYRRQDVYDIALLLGRFGLDDGEKAGLLALFFEKCRARGIEPDRAALARPEVARRAAAGWDSLALEIGEVPPFRECFAVVEGFYRALPWAEQAAILGRGGPA